MRAFSINAQTREVEELEVDMQANTVYTFFNSIEIDDFQTIERHTVHSDSQALSKEKKPFFLGEQLIVGDALIFGEDGFLDVEVTIPKADLESLVNYEVSDFYIKSLEILKRSDINLYRAFEVQEATQNRKLNTEWVLYVFNVADEKTKEYFLVELQKAVDAESDIFAFMRKMATLAIKAMG